MLSKWSGVKAEFAENSCVGPFAKASFLKPSSSSYTRSGHQCLYYLWLIQPLLMAGGYYLCLERRWEKYYTLFKTTKTKKTPFRKMYKQGQKRRRALNTRKKQSAWRYSNRFCAVSWNLSSSPWYGGGPRPNKHRALRRSGLICVRCYLLACILFGWTHCSPWRILGLHLHQSSKKIIQPTGFSADMKGAPHA